MLIGEKISQPALSASKNMPGHNALALFKREKIRRASLIESEKRIGIISDKDALNAAPSQVASLSVWGIQCALSKVAVREALSKISVEIADLRECETE